MERYGAKLEGDPGQREDEPKGEAEAGGAGGREGRAKSGKGGGAREAIEQADAVEQDAAGERAEHEIFEPGLGGAGVVAAVGGQHVGGKAGKLEPDVEHHQVGGADHHRRADRREQDQHRIFGAMFEVLVEPAVGHDDGNCRCQEDDDLAEGCKGVGGPHAAKGAAATLGREHQQDAGPDEQRHRGDMGEAGRAADEGGDHHQRDRAEAEQDLGKDCGKGHQCAPSEMARPGVWCAGLGAPAVGRLSPFGVTRSIRVSSRPTSSRIGAMKLSG